MIKIKIIMKNRLSLIFIGSALLFFLSACGASKGAHCDAYGSIDEIENSDLANL